MKKILTLLICVMMFSNSFMTVYATNTTEYTTKDGVTVKILEDNANFRIVESSNDTMVSKVTYNKNKNTMDIKEFNKITKITKNKSLDLNKSNPTNFTNNRPSAIWDEYVNVHSNLNSDYYYIYNPTPDYWAIGVKNKKLTHIRADDELESYLYKFSDAIDDMIKEEKVVMASVGAEVFAAIAGAIVTPEPITTIAGILAAAGIALSSLDNIISWRSCASTARKYYKIIDRKL